LNERINRLANGLTRLGVNPGDVVAAFEFDSHRYLECFFRRARHGGHASNRELEAFTRTDRLYRQPCRGQGDHRQLFLPPAAAAIRDKLTTVQKVVLISDGAKPPETTLVIDAEYELLLAEAGSQYDFPDLDENTRATTFYTTGTTGNPKGVFFSHRQLVLHTSPSPLPWAPITPNAAAGQMTSTCP